MINGLEGIPGSGKSYEAVVYHVLHALKRGRLVITNLPLNLEAFAAIDPEWLNLIEIRSKPLPVRGTWDAERVPAFELFAPGDSLPYDSGIYTRDGMTVQAKPKTKLFGHVWDFYSEWKAADGSGPLFIIDECHVGMPKLGTDLQVIEWFKLHRHFNVDVLLCTQKFRHMDQSIAELMGMLIRVRKADILGRKDSYIRKVFAGYQGAVISTDERKYQDQYFGLYKSHTQGNSVAESIAADVTPMLVKFKRFSRVFTVLVICFCVYAFWPGGAKSKKSESKPAWLDAAAAEYKKNPPRGSEFASPPLLPASAASSALGAVPAVPGASSGDDDPEPFKAQGLHLTGWLSSPGKQDVYTFAVSSGGQLLFNLTLVEIEKSGYDFEPLGECAGILRYGKKVRPVICDAPAIASGRQNYPVVLAGAARVPS